MLELNSECQIFIAWDEQNKTAVCINLKEQELDCSLKINLALEMVTEIKLQPKMVNI